MKLATEDFRMSVFGLGTNASLQILSVFTAVEGATLSAVSHHQLNIKAVI